MSTCILNGKFCSYACLEQGIPCVIGKYKKGIPISETPISETPISEHSEKILHEAMRIIYGDRRTDYGSAEESFNNIWTGWNIIISSNIPGAEKVALCMDWLKTCRYLVGRQRDSLVDKAGYVGCIEQIREDL